MVGGGRRQKRKRQSVVLFRYPLLWSCYLEATVGHHLTIAHVCALKPQQQIHLTLFVRNVWALTLPNVKQNTAYTAHTFFSNGYTATYTHTRGLSGTFEISWPGKRVGEGEVWRNFEWDLEYLPNRWFPLRQGKIQDDPRFDYRIPFECKKSWKEYPPSTRVGWRGPCVLTRELQNMPQIFYVELYPP